MAIKYVLITTIFIGVFMSQLADVTTHTNCSTKTAVYNIVCSRFEFWCTTQRNVKTYEAICKNVTIDKSTVTFNIASPKLVYDIELFYANMPSIFPGIFDDFVNMKRLYIQNGNTEVIESNALQKISNLDWLIIKNNRVKSIQKNAFAGLNLLNVLNLNNNNLTSINKDMFSDLVVVKYLSLKNNQISEISDDSFTNLKLLGVLFLNNNNLSYISENVFSANKELRILWLQANNIKSVAEKFFLNKPLLTDVLLDNNQLDYFNWHLARANISLHHNKLKDLQPFGPITTDFFDLSFNNITKVPAKTFVLSNKLEYLLLNDNSIKSIHEDSLVELKKLKFLSLENNKINEISLGTFRDLNSLQTLTLSGNQLAHIESGVFTGLSNLRLLDLSRNKIASVQVSALYSLKFLRTFRLDNNLLNSIVAENLATHLKSLKEISLDNNNWNCDWLSTNMNILEKYTITIIPGESLKTNNVQGIACIDSKIPASNGTDDSNKIVIDNRFNSDKLQGKDVAAPATQSVQTYPSQSQPQPQPQPTASHHVQLNIITTLVVITFIIVIALVVKRYFWRRRMTLRHIPSTETVACKLEFVE